MSNQNLDALYGEPGKGEYAPGDSITFEENGQTFTGEVIHVDQPGYTVGGRYHPLQYQVDIGSGWPSTVYSSQVVAR